mmetsp:Transcript_26307/g.36349  ORF Transcript_26307/g.36349 Transcript_26307/m.36349 type:complete len:194 (+) Transcript_26307:288-869(+)|eukprot:CAMPEP_0196579080 /NCGR_PEP_ID=MMETSP1081-20130531/17633_1 /TAXON_ID=36882 /ORGANISM="Pyramimonas amylifera, Strain CCMP720" /LENGTH=193 /DNA_ID=CAMNT_0041898535 /DNA_START=117 /DNA_END=698 /DNA_ORIENTATION=+
MGKKAGKGKSKSKEKPKVGEWKDDRMMKDKTSDIEVFIDNIIQEYDDIFPDLNDGLENFKLEFRRRLQLSKDAIFPFVVPEKLLKAQRHVDDIFDHVTPLVVNLMNEVQFHMTITKHMIVVYKHVEHRQHLQVRKLMFKCFCDWSAVIIEENNRHHCQIARPEVHALKIRIEEQLLRSYLRNWKNVIKMMYLT